MQNSIPGCHLRASGRHAQAIVFRRSHGRFAAVLLALFMLAGEQGQAADHRGTTIQWDAHSLVLIQERSHYGRMLRLSDDRYSVYLQSGTHGSRPTKQRRRSHLLHPFRIMACQSTDQGTTWTGHRPVYEAGLDRRAGCWEPAQIQLPSGEIQLFFANEKPYADTNEQEITLLRSTSIGINRRAIRRRRTAGPR